MVIVLVKSLAMKVFKKLLTREPIIHRCQYVLLLNNLNAIKTYKKSKQMYHHNTKSKHDNIRTSGIYESVSSWQTLGQERVSWSSKSSADRLLSSILASSSSVYQMKRVLRLPNYQIACILQLWYCLRIIMSV